MHARIQQGTLRVHHRLAGLVGVQESAFVGPVREHLGADAAAGAAALGGGARGVEGVLGVE